MSISWAMGSSVGLLTKTNADAQRFVDVMQPLFQVKAAHIRLIKDARKADFTAAMVWLRAQVNPNDLVLIFFSGHGSRVPDDNGDEADGWDEGFVMFDVQDAGYASSDHLVRDDQFTSWLDGLATDRVLTVIDSCFSAGLKPFAAGSRTYQVLHRR